MTLRIDKIQGQELEEQIRKALQEAHTESEMSCTEVDRIEVEQSLSSSWLHEPSDEILRS